jgi:hypothetical protein
LTKVTIIFFTYNRALQLDAALTSLVNNFVNLQMPIHVIYHWSSQHEVSYQSLKAKWQPKGVVFHQRGELISIRKITKLLIRPLNLYWYLKMPWIRDSFDDFKYILENIIENCDGDFISFSTDDQLMFDNTYITESVFDLIRSAPKKYSYRFITSLDFEGEYAIPKGLNINLYYENGKPAFFEWDNKNEFKSILWKYRFNVDGTVFEKKTILRLLKPMLYHMPTTLESGGLWESRFRNYFRFGLSSIKRTSIGIQANNIQTVSDTPCAYFEPEILRQAYEEGYHLVFDKSMVNENNYIYIPTELIMQHHITRKIITYTGYVNSQEKNN